jgi:hypothetical protein
MKVSLLAPLVSLIALVAASDFHLSPNAKMVIRHSPLRPTRSIATKAAQCAAVKQAQQSLQSIASVSSTSVAAAASKAAEKKKEAELGDDAGTMSGDGTWYTDWETSCGYSIAPTDHKVAVSHEMYDTFPGATADSTANPICGKWITIKYGGNTAQAQVVDKCMGCWLKGALDMTPTLFQIFADLGEGRIHNVEWSFND